MKLFVSIAINLSFLESIILVPVTPTALQPIPIHMVKACLPQELHLLNIPSKLNDILGNSPISSNIVNKGKNISIGGSITLITQVVVLYNPNTRTLLMLFGKNDKKLYIGTSNDENILNSKSLG